MDFTDDQKKVVIYLMIFIGVAIVIIAMLTNYWIVESLPPQPNLTIGNGRTVEMVKEDINNYKNLVAIIKDQNETLNNLLVVKFLKGIFDSLILSIISYVFGKPLIKALSIRLTGNSNKSL